MFPKLHFAKQLNLSHCLLQLASPKMTGAKFVPQEHSSRLLILNYCLTIFKDHPGKDRLTASYSNKSNHFRQLIRDHRFNNAFQMAKREPECSLY